MNDTPRDTESELAEIASKLKGKTLQVYWYLLKNPKEASLREIQRGAGLSSPSLASYHLDKLESLGLIRVDSHGSFYLERNVKVGVLRYFVGSGKLLVPRHVFYAVFYTTLLLCYLAFFPLTTGPVSLLLLSVLGFGIATSWLESYRAWRIEV